MNKKALVAVAAVAIILLGGIVWLAVSLNQEKQANREMQELAEMDKKEMENEYKQFADQYSEMKTRINNDSIIAQLSREQLRTQELLKELKNEADDADVPLVRKAFYKTLMSFVRSLMLGGKLPRHLAFRNVEAVEDAYRQSERAMNDDLVLSFLVDRISFPTA